MKSRVRSSASRQPWTKRLLLGFVLTVIIIVAGANVAHRAWQGHGRWHQLAKTLYHEFKGTKAQAAALPSERADAPLVIYDNKLADGWQDYSWGTHDLAHTAPVHSGYAAMNLTPGGNRGLYLHHDPFGTGGYGTLQAFIHGDTTTRLCLVGGDAKFGPFVTATEFLRPDPSGRSGWHLLSIPLADLGVPKSGQTVTGIVFQPIVGASLPLVVDDLSLLPDLSLPTAPTEATVGVTVNVDASRRPISPFIYGMAFAPDDYLTDLRLGLNRWGGNDKSRYNWVLGNAVNAGSDWEFRNRYATDGPIPPGPSSAADRFVEANRARKTASLLTVPTLGWVARDTDNSHQSVNVPASGGPGLHGADGAIAGYDPAANRARTSVRSVARKGRPFADWPSLAGGVVYQDEWIAHLKKRFGDGAHGGVQFYAMDNEPDLWDSTHKDVHPARMGYDDVLHNFLDYSTAIKAVDPTAMITGPVSWGWPGYNDSALDRGDDNFATQADHVQHGNAPFLLWFLKQTHAHDIKTGQRTLDVLDVHFYPSGDGVFGGHSDSGGTDKATQALRLRSTRALWDPAYRDESWIGQPVRLIPRLKEWIAEGYPGTGIGISEWSFGADSHINGGLAVADALGIFGREGVTLANYWAWPAKNSPGYLAFKLYRNPDGLGNGFGDISCAAASADSDRLSCYAATDSRTGDLTLLLINKMPKATITAPLVIKGASPVGTVKMWRCAADNPREIRAFGTAPLKGALTLPPQSMTLVRLPMPK